MEKSRHMDPIGIGNVLHHKLEHLKLILENWDRNRSFSEEVNEGGDSEERELNEITPTSSVLLKEEVP
ncbi:UNVERIFIED_CONTAM: hypothetical protein K2H54_029115 [Gekko kuhli]